MSTPSTPPAAPALVIVVMGVSGSGKSTIGALLATRLGCEFLDGDELHPAANVAKMSSGIPLTDADRAPWLAAIRDRIAQAEHQSRSLVVACSALRQSYRDLLRAAGPLVWVYLHGTPELFYQRMELRKGHFMKAGMLASQLATLEPPAGAILADAAQTPEQIVAAILGSLPAASGGGSGVR